MYRVAMLVLFVAPSVSGEPRLLRKCTEVPQRVAIISGGAGQCTMSEVMGVGSAPDKTVAVMALMGSNAPCGGCIMGCATKAGAEQTSCAMACAAGGGSAPAAPPAPPPATPGAPLCLSAPLHRSTPIATSLSTDSGLEKLRLELPLRCCSCSDHCSVRQGPKRRRLPAPKVRLSMGGGLPRLGLPVAGFGTSDVGHRCSKAPTDNKNVKICADSKGTACPLDTCRTKCVENKDFVCKWYAHDPAKNDCYLYETCNNNAADPDYNAYFLVAADATTAAGATSSTSPVPVHHVHSDSRAIRPPQWCSRPPPTGCMQA